MSKLRVGFIGLGLMGSPMAKNILKAGFPLFVYNRTPKKAIKFKKLGILLFKTPKDLAKEVDVIVIMITGPKDVFEVLFGKNGVVFGAKKGLIIVDMSTIGKQSAVEIFNKLKKRGIEFLDAPVTGSVPKAVSGELTIFVGGSLEAFNKVKPVLLSMGKNVHHMGRTGMGQAIKLVNNLLVAQTISALCEGMILADNLGLLRQKVADALGEVPALSPFMKMKLPNMVNNKFETAFSVANMHKDLKLAQKELKKKKSLKMLKLVEGFFEKAEKTNLGNLDISAVLKVIEKR